MANPPEIWRAIADHAPYEISNYGRVRRGTHIKTLVRDRKGYLSVTLWVSAKPKKVSVQRLVAAAFIGQRQAGHVVRHRNGINDDNRDVNLLYGTPTENEADKLIHGTKARGQKHGSAKLTDALVLAIRARLARSLNPREMAAIAREFKLPYRLAWAAATGRTWKHLT